MYFYKDHQSKGYEDAIPPGLKSLSNSAPNSPFLGSRINHPKDPTTSKTAAVQPKNSSSATMAQTQNTSKGTIYHNEYDN